MGYGTKDKMPGGAKSTDGGGERSEPMVNGVGQGKEDGDDRAKGGKERGEYNTGRSESVCYNHKKAGY